MNISKVALVSNSAMIKNHKACREKAEDLDKLYILKNNQLDAVLFSMAKYEIKLDDIKNEVVEGHRKIMSDIGKLPKSAQ